MTTFAQVQAALSQIQPVAFHGGTNLPHGSKSAFAMTGIFDFSATGIPAQGYVVDTTVFANKLQMKTVQTIYIDNGGNNGFVEVFNPVFNQSFALTPGYQGYFPIMASLISGSVFYVTSTGNNIARVSFLNSLMPLAAWAATIVPPSSGNPQTVSDPILDATVLNNRVRVSTLVSQTSATDRSGTIAVANVAQSLVALNPVRQGFFLQNIDPVINESLWFGFSAGIVPGGPGAFGLGQASNINFPGGSFQSQVSNQIFVVAATAGHKFSAFEWA
jgi:hypothetical protein